MSSEGYGRHEGGRGEGGLDRFSSQGSHPRNGFQQSRSFRSRHPSSSSSSSSSLSSSHHHDFRGARRGTNRKAQQQKRSSEREERLTRQTMQSMFFLHSSAAHSFVLTRRCTSASSAAVISSSANYNYHGPDVGVKWDAVRIVKCFAEISGDEGRDAAAAAVAKSMENEVDLLPVCPICLDSHAAARITKCGHTFCLPCILHHVHSASASSSSSTSESATGKALVKCPCCSELVDIDQLRPVHFVTVNKLRVLPPSSNANNNHKKVRFVKLHRSRGSFAPFLPQYLLPDGNTYANVSDDKTQHDVEMGTALKRLGPNAAPSQTDVDAQFCRFNYVDVPSYRRHFMADLTLLQNRCDELRSAGLTSSFDSVFLEMATQSVQQELTRLEEWAAEEEALRVLYSEDSSFMVERRMGRPFPPPLPPVFGKKSKTPASSLSWEESCGRESWDEDGVKDEGTSNSAGASADFEKVIAKGEEGNNSVLAMDSVGYPPRPSAEIGTTDCNGGENSQNFATQGISKRTTASDQGRAGIEDGTNENQNSSGAVASEDGGQSAMAGTTDGGGVERRGSRRRGCRPRGGSYGSVGSLPVPQASMYLDDDCTQFYQSSDGQLCFLSRFNMNCLAAEFSTHPPSTSDQNAKEPEIGDTPSDATLTVLNEEEAAFLRCRKRRPLPDYVEGEVMETESVHLTPDVRRRMPFLSHLPLYTDVTFVELNLQRLLSEETKAQFREEFERRKKKRRNRKQSEKQADRSARKAEEERINERKARMQFIDPKDEFFHAIPLSPHTEESVLLNSDDFGPGLEDGTGQQQQRQQQQPPPTAPAVGQGSWAAGPPPASSPTLGPSRSDREVTTDDFFGPPLPSAAASGEADGRNPAMGRGSWAAGPPPSQVSAAHVASPSKHTKRTKKLVGTGIGGASTDLSVGRGSWAGGPPPATHQQRQQQLPKSGTIATQGRNTTILSALSATSNVRTRWGSVVSSRTAQQSSSDAMWRVVDSSRTPTASVRSTSEFPTLGGGTGAPGKQALPMNKGSGKVEKKNKVLRV